MSTVITDTSNRELVSIRVINAPVELVFQAWSDPERLSVWWGPDGFTNTFHQYDFRPGGTWEFTMHGPDGVSYENKSIFKEIITPRRIVFDHLGPIHQFRAIASFDSLADKTRLTFSMIFELASEYEKLKALIAEANEQNFNRLEAMIFKTQGPL